MVRIVVNPGYKVRAPALRRDAVAGEIVEVTAREAAILKALRRASDAPAEVVAATAKPALEGAPETAAAVPVEPMDTGNSAPIVPPRRGRYMRRDERAEDE